MNVFEALRKRYPAPAWAFMEEVRNGTGYGRTVRTADALAMSLYPSRGLHLHGFEIKQSRSDWTREWKDPEKAEEIAQYCHFWWLVVSDEKIVRDGELPATWGLLAMRGEELHLAKQPTLNPDALPPSHKFLGAVLRKFAASDTDGARLERAAAEGFQKGRDAGYQQGLKASGHDRWQKMYEEQRAEIQKFQDQSGIVLGQYGVGNVGSIVKLLTTWDSPARSFERLAKQAAEIAEVCQRGAQEAAALLPRTEAP